MDVSIVLTEEWTDKQLTWVTGKTALTSVAQNDEKSQSDTKSRRRRSYENDIASDYDYVSPVFPVSPESLPTDPTTTTTATATTDPKERDFLKK